MTYSARWADARSARRYPLPVRGTAAFTPAAQGVELRMPLPEVPANQIIVPSFASVDVERYQWRLEHQGEHWPLLPVPSARDERPDRLRPATRVSSHIDCWHSHAALSDAELVLWCTSEPATYMIALSVRPLDLEAQPPLDACSVAPAPRQLSQMTAPADIRHHTCSPTSTAMLLANAAPDTVATLCRDEATGMFGSWPLAVRAAAKHGALAAVEAFSSWQPALAVLAAGLPFCASIRFAEDGLDGAPLNRTGGHLVVVYGVREGRVLAHDPAAESVEAVPRSYDATQFTRAWLAHRGASYIIAP